MYVFKIERELQVFQNDRFYRKTDIRHIHSAILYIGELARIQRELRYDSNHYVLPACCPLYQYERASGVQLNHTTDPIFTRCTAFAFQPATDKSKATQQGDMPQQESRVKKTLLNARVNLIFYFLTLALSFFSRKIFLDCLGADFAGLTGTLQNILGYVNLAELGVGTAIGYTLYKPVYDHNEDAIKEIISVLGYIYRIIGIIILVVGTIVSFFLPIIFPVEGTGFSQFLVYFLFYSFIFSSLIGYFINYRQSLLGADQRGYVTTTLYQSVIFAKTLVQMYIAYSTKNYYIWAIVEVVFNIVYSLILNRKINKIYPWLKTNISEGKHLLKKYPHLLKHTRQIFIHKFAYVITSQSYNIVVYAFSSLSMVAYFGNYVIIADKVQNLISTAMGSVVAGLGNLVAENNLEKTQSVFRQLLSLQNFIAGAFIFGMVAFSSAFIGIWLGKKYILPLWIILPYFLKKYIDTGNSLLGNALFVHGLFADIWAPFVEAAIFYLVAILCGMKWGLFGVMLGTLASTIAIPLCWKSYYLYRDGLNLPWIVFWKQFFLQTTIQFSLLYFILYIYDFLYPSIDYTWITLICRAILLTVIFITSSGILTFIMDKSFREVTKRIYELILDKIK